MIFSLCFFVFLQVMLLFVMLSHDLIPMRPFNDVDALKQNESMFRIILFTVINALCVAVPLYMTLFHYNTALLTIVYCYGGLTIGTIASWWVPYVFGSSVAHKQQFLKFKNTHYFLPKRGDNVRPNTLHVVLHLLVWSCFGLSLYFYLSNMS